MRTLRRDIDRLRELGYPVEAHRGVDGGYQLAAGAALPPLVLDDEEAVALAVGLQAAAQGAIAGVAEASVRALAKVVQVMPPRLRRRVEALRTATVAASGPAGRPSTRRADRRRPGLPGHRAGRVRLPAAAARAPNATSSRTGWCPLGGAGTWWPTTCTGTTGAASAWTGSDAARDRRPVPSARPAGRRRRGVRPRRHRERAADRRGRGVVDAPAAAVRERVGRWGNVEEVGDRRCCCA